MSSTPSTASSSGARRASPLLWRLAGLSRLDFTSPRATYVLRSIAAAWLALCVAYVLQLEMPYSAASTVLLVINPIQGAVIGKGAWRVLGTLAGMIASVLLMSAFGQMPWLFLLGFAVWLGLCVAGMTMLRHFRASGVVVAGYTVGLATFGALQHPQLTFEHVVGRGSTVMVGVLCLSLVSALFSARSVQGKLEGLLTRLASRTAQMQAAAYESAGAKAHEAAAAQRELISEIYGVDDLLAVGKAESADLAHRAHAVRHAMASLFAVVAGGVPLAVAGQRDTRDSFLTRLQPMLAQAWRDTTNALVQGAQGLTNAARIMREAREQLVAALDTRPALPPATLIAIDRLIEQVDDYLAALDGLTSLHRPRPANAPATVRFHRDPRAAWQNGLRAALTLFAAGAVWIITGWPHGDMMLLIVSPYCALLATAPNPAAGAWQFVKGTLLAVPMAFVCAFGVLPHIEGLPLLLVVLALFWLPGIVATTMPQHGLAALAYLVGFNTLTAADNPMHYHLGLFLNWSLAWVVGAAFAWMGFRLFLPRQLPRDIARLRRHIREASLRVLHAPAQRAPLDRLMATARGWQWRQQHRIAHLGALRKTQPDAMRADIADALASLHLGRDVWRLRVWMCREDVRPSLAGACTIVTTALDRMARRLHTRYPAPALAARHARRAARHLTRLQTTGDCPHADEAQHLPRLVAVLTDIADLLDGYAVYFAQPLPNRSHAQ
ncbi:FUSC family protein [Pandoraea apista]|uniref:FUSC family protein n=1 Tax=Pandoraea apista TaxID=93218 RepID=A0A5E5PB68_9BURK|nr:FUSC family protein [Pandoraea apista]VVG73540.1 FUSC family protein [Pandoraea apista]